MAFDLGQIRTIAILMFENRSFDHLLGHLSLSGYPVDGLRGTINPAGRLMNDQYSNGYQGTAYYPFQMRDGRLLRDPPHGRQSVETVQLARSPVTGRFTMRGFVNAYHTPDNPNRTESPEPLGFLGEEDTPVSSFLARQYAVCDRWFSCVPGDTHANRLMALSGFTKIDHIDKIPVLPSQPTMLDWLRDRDVRWRVYRNGLSFFTLMPQYLEDIANGNGFRSVSQLAADVRDEPDATFPEVLIIEPSYLDAPIALEDPPNDNHPSLPVAPGEAYLARVYGALAAGRRWASTLFIVTYDEHGGFFDHVPPPPIPCPIPAGANYTVPFTSAGVRVPSMVISPFVKPGTVFSQVLDHTSILQLLADRFAAGTAGYSPEVNARRAAGVKSVAAVLDDPAAGRAAAPIPRAPAQPPAAVVPVARAAQTPMQRAFAEATKRLKAHPTATATHPGLGTWMDVGG
jgi:phospholipase C